MTDHKFSDSSRRLGAAALDLLSDHAELFALELQEQKHYSSQQLIWLAMTAACGFMLFLLLNGLLIMSLWSHYEHKLLIAMSAFLCHCWWFMHLADEIGTEPRSTPF